VASVLAIRPRHQPDVRQPGHTVNKNDVRRLHIAMHQAMAMNVAERAGQLHAERDGFRYG
jgi:hypothetical protein